jgi:undecaprenyl diphosphate synthase
MLLIIFLNVNKVIFLSFHIFKWISSVLIILLELFNKYLYQDLPSLDLVIRTSGEQRLSNFMLFQSAYAELYFPNTYFPDFNNKEFDKALEYYYKRNRRFGGINNENKSS